MILHGNNTRVKLSSNILSEVRRVVLAVLAPFNSDIVSSLLRRSRDVSEYVRKHLYLVVMEKLPLRKLTQQQRVSLLADGLHDRSETVRQNCIRMLGAWLKQCSDSSAKLLSYLGVVANQDIAALSAFRLLENEQLDCNDIDIHNLSNEQALFVRVFCQFLQQKTVLKT